MLWQVFVEIVRDAVQGVQARPGDGREVVVLVVQANVVGEEIQRSVVRVCFRERNLVGGIHSVFVGLLENVMFGDEVAGAGVERAGEEAAHDQVSQGPSSCESNECVIEG